MRLNRINKYFGVRTRKSTGKITRRQVRIDTVVPPSSSKHHIVSKRGSNWAWEIAALGVSIGAVSALVVLLVCVDSLSLDAWTSPISLNALVSVLAAISRASLGFTISSCLAQTKWNWYRKQPDSLIGFDRFDDASRGPWGSLWLIIWLRKPHWVAIGAVATILLVGFEPFLQVIISFSGQFQAKHGSSQATTRAGIFLDVGSYMLENEEPPISLRLNPSNESATFSKFNAQSDDGISSTFISGFYITSSNDSLPSPKFSCSTSNCTWEAFPTIAICSSCEDITRNLVSQVVSQVINKDVRHSISHTLPFINITNWSDSTGAEDDSVQMTATRFTDSQYTISFKNISTMITTVQVIKAAESYGIYGATSSYTWADTKVTATECSLYFCVNVLESVVENGVFRERIVNSWHQRNMNSYLNQSSNDDGNNFDSYEIWNNHSLYSLHGDFARDDLKFNISENELERYNSNYFQYPSPFRLTQNTIGSFLHFINNETLTANMVWPRGRLPIIQSLYETQNLTELFDNVAQLVSTWIRDVHGFKVTGIEQEWVIHIQVKWLYTLLPLLTISLGYMFSVWTMLETRHLRLQPWKTDMVATLAHSADVETGVQLMRANRNGNLTKVARSMKVRLENTKRGLELRVKRNSKRR